MSDHGPNSHTEALRADPLAWIVVRHFLDAGVLRELCEVVVEHGSGGALFLSDLFEEITPNGSDVTASWFVRPRLLEGSLANHLAHVVTHVLWQSDEAMSPLREGVTADEAERLRALNSAFTVSIADLGQTPIRLDEGSIHRSLRAVVEAVNVLGEHGTAVASAEAVSAAQTVIQDRHPVLGALLVKHLGDLCADADQWHAAKALYSLALRLIETAPVDDWTDVTDKTRVIVRQSEAMAVWHLEGPEKSSRLLEGLIENVSIEAAPLAVINASYDAMTARLASGDLYTYTGDRRVAALYAPLLLHSHDFGAAYSASLVGRHRDAARRFWGVLRRQTALGGTTQARFTKAHFARAILAELEETVDRHDRKEDFALVVRLLVESGEPPHAERIRWSDHLVAAYLTPSILQQIEEMIERAPGMTIGRRMVASILYRDWLKAIDADRSDLAVPMLDGLMKTATEGSHSGLRNVATGSQALKALREIGMSRPEFHILTGDGICTVLDRVLTAWGPLPISEALATASSFMDGSDDRLVEMIALRTIDLVDQLPQDAFTPITRAASDLLNGRAVSKLTRQSAPFRLKRDRALIRLALNSSDEHVSLLWLLGWVDPKAVSEQLDADRIDEIIDGVRDQAMETRSSNAASCIHGLLLAPRVVGRERVEAALGSLEQIIRSSEERRPSPALANAYDPIILLARERVRISTDADLSQQSFDATIEKLIQALCVLWHEAAKRPLIFGGFAIPPNTRPNPTLVHNWTFASLELASAAGDVARMERVMNDARRNEQLATAMATGAAARKDATDKTLFDAAAIAGEPADAFYAVLGERLTAIDGGADDVDVTVALLNRCLLVGPRGEDAGILLLARHAGMMLDPDTPAVVSYQAKLVRDRKLRLSLSALLNAVLRNAEQ